MGDKSKLKGKNPFIVLGQFVKSQLFLKCVVAFISLCLLYTVVTTPCLLTTCGSEDQPFIGGLDVNGQLDLKPEDFVLSEAMTLAVQSTENTEGAHVHDATFDPFTNVAWCIPAGGKTKRVDQLKAIFDVLMTDNGVLAETVFVFEDDLGRPGGSPSVEVAKLCKEYGVRVINSKIVRDGPENSNTFGRYLGRHYHFMADTIFLGSATGFGSIADPTEGTIKPFEYAVFLEDDLLLAADIVQYFHQMAKVMRVDPSIYCASAHVDNAFYATSYRFQEGKAYSDPNDFHFRRGNHFMAPGWMSSRRIYLTVVRPAWLDEEFGNYKYKAGLRLPNGHWDRFWDSRIGDKDCIFPEVPRILHVGGGGFTVSSRAQLELYAGLRLADVPATTPYPDVTYLTRKAYDEQIRTFLAGALDIAVPGQAVSSAGRYQHMKLRVVAADDKDQEWNILINQYFGLIGVGGYGGYQGYVKLRGVYKGTVLIRWNTNLIMLVAEYSTFYRDGFVPAENIGFMGNDMTQIEAWDCTKKTVSPVDLRNMARPAVPVYAGCFKDSHTDRVLPYHVPWISRQALSPSICLQTCLSLSYPFAGVQNGRECWCGSGKRIIEGGNKLVASSDSFCDAKKCLKPDPYFAHANIATATTSQNTWNTQLSCGGPLYMSVYSAVKGAAQARPLQPPADVAYVVGEAGQTCTEACIERGSPEIQLSCAEELFPIIQDSCDSIELISMAKCDTCQRDDIVNSYSPGFDYNSLTKEMHCYTQSAPRVHCGAKNVQQSRGKQFQFHRICVCAVAQQSTPLFP